LSKSDCFFTNIYPGLRICETNSGTRLPSSVGFKDTCVQFLRSQIRAMSPRLIVVFGVKAREFVGLNDRENSILRLTRLNSISVESLGETPIMHLSHPSGRGSGLITEAAGLLRTALNQLAKTAA
jgi:uracil-DNA glycosylase